MLSFPPLHASRVLCFKVELFNFPEISVDVALYYSLDEKLDVRAREGTIVVWLLV